jgi:dihydroorotase-like cyclic amidohydrolase
MIAMCRTIGTCCCSGQAAALAGGTTMHIDFALPVNGSLSAGLTEWRRKAAIAVMDYGFHMAVTSWDAQVSLSVLSSTPIVTAVHIGRL